MNTVNWLLLNDLPTIDEIIEQSHSTPCLIYKHSTRCSISSLAQNRLEKSWSLPKEELLPYYLDLIAYRNVSNAVAERFGVRHESPQVLLIKNGKCIYDASHMGIDAQRISQQMVEV